MKLVFNKNDFMRRIAKDLVKLKGLTPQEASEKTGVPVEEILREYEEPSPKYTTVAPDGKVTEHGRE